ncbi:MAG: hypothetical protein U0271_30715 [Polyangiaceae bacterium]
MAERGEGKESPKWFESSTLLPPHPRAAVTRRLIEVIPSFQRLCRAAVAVANVTTAEDFDSEWGLLLGAAIPHRNGALSGAAEKRLMLALLENRPLFEDARTPARLASFGLPTTLEGVVSLFRIGGS